MTEYNAVYGYFLGKANEWKTKSGTPQAYIRQKGREGLREEFSNDPAFRQVCTYANSLSESQMTSSVQKSFEGAVGLIFGIPLVGELDIVLGAIEDVCGNLFVGRKLLTVGAIAIGAAIVIAALRG